MAMSHFENIRVVLAEPNAELRTELKEQLEGFGLKNVLPTGNLSRIASAVERGEVDLLIADTSLPEGDFNEFVHAMRHGKQGANPFLVVITLVNEPSRTAVQAAIDAGTDHVLAKPFSPEALIEKVVDLTHARKRFVVTTDYIGPDRRSAHREGTMQIPLIDVPNPLHHRITGHMSIAQVRASVESAVVRINEQKVVRHAYQVGWLLDYAIPEMAALNAGLLGETPENLHKLCEVLEDTCERIRGTRYLHVSEMLMTLSRMAREALETGLCEEDMQLMGRMADIVGRLFDPDRDAQASEYHLRARMRALGDTAPDKSANFSRKNLSPKELAAIAVA